MISEFTSQISYTEKKNTIGDTLAEWKRNPGKGMKKEGTIEWPERLKEAKHMEWGVVWLCCLKILFCIR